MSPGPASSALMPREFITKNLSDLPRDVLHKILHDNAVGLYHMD
jgi:uncharacterized protein